jgi:hypothetical protein
MTQEKRKAPHFKLLILCVVLYSTTINAQTKPPYLINQAKQIVAFMDTARKNMPVEKLYLQMDKFNYLSSDTLWFKAYLLEGPYLLPSTKSGIFYVELVSPDNKVVKRLKFPAKYGLGWGNISLEEKDLPKDKGLPTGNYLLRAYTTWMLNFGEAAAYTTTISISNTNGATGMATLKKNAKNRAAATALPATNTSLAVNSSPDKPDLEVTITVEGEARNFPAYYLVGQSRGVVCYAVPVDLNSGKVVNKVEKGLFPTGIARFTLMDRNLQAIHERMIFIDQHDQLNIGISTAPTIYKGRDSIALRIRVTDKNNEPVQGSFSLAVTDDHQVIRATPTKGNLNAYMQLSSELVNQDKDAEAYTNGTTAAQQALDSSVGTYGWLGYNWKEVVNHKEPKYKAEPEFMITGKVSSTFSGMSEAKLSLFVRKPMLFMDTVADANGRFVFKNLPITDTAVYKIQATNKKGKNFFANLEVDEWIPPVFSSLVSYSTKAEVTDTALVQKIEKALALKQQVDKPSGKLLNEVNIAAKKWVKDSQNLNGSGEADQVLTEEDLLKEGKKTLFDVLLERIPGLVRGSYEIRPPDVIKPKLGLKLKNQVVKFIMDGIDLDQGYVYWQPAEDTSGFEEGIQERYLFLKANLDNFTAEDVKGIEVMYNVTYNMKYNSMFLSTAELNTVGGARAKDYTYIEITTRSGKGPFMKQTPGTYLYKPLAFSLPKKFYNPRYLSKDSTGTDIRSTIHWEPNIVTDEKGEAIISFYAADLPTSYTIVVEGSDMNGRLGSVIKPAFLKVTH